MSSGNQISQDLNNIGVKYEETKSQSFYLDSGWTAMM